MSNKAIKNKDTGGEKTKLKFPIRKKNHNAFCLPQKKPTTTLIHILLSVVSNSP